MSTAKATARDWIDDRHPAWTDWNRTIWEYGETAWREYLSADLYVDILRREGFEVEVGSGGMPTAFCAVWDNSGPGRKPAPTIGGYAEYDAIPGNCQAADVVKRPRDGLSPHAGGHTDPHSALGMGSLVGFLAAKQAMQKHKIRGRLKFMGEPAEKVRGSKPIHAALGYYDDMDAAISFHPHYMLPYCNTVRWDTHCGAAFAPIYTFTCREPQDWLKADGPAAPFAAYHASVRPPGPNDAVVQLYQLGKTLKEHLLASGQSWSMNEAILTMGQATADNLPATLAQIMYMTRVPTIAEAERIVRALDQFAESAARMTHCDWRRDWVCKSRPGLPNHALSRLTYDNLVEAGPPVYSAEAVEVARKIQRNLGCEPLENPIAEALGQCVEPTEAERQIRRMLPATQLTFTSDDYTDYCWHAPTVRLYVGRVYLEPLPDGRAYPTWVGNALGGINATIDPTVRAAGRTIAGTVLDLLTEPRHLEAAQAEFVERTGGGRGGSKWIAPLCDYPAPVDFRWPEYVTTPRGKREWVIPAMPGID